MKHHQSIHIELKFFHANFQNGGILSTPLIEPLNYQNEINFFILGATLDLLVINMQNQTKPNVCQSLVLQVYFQKEVLWIAGFYLSGLWSNNNFGSSHQKSHFLHFQNPIWWIWQILKICKIEKFEIFLEDYHNINFQIPSKSFFFKKDLWKCHFFAKCVFFAILNPHWVKL